MAKLLTLSFILLIVGGAIYDMPRQCYSTRLFGTCARVQLHTLSAFEPHMTDWDAVDAVRVIR
jgi:hypothetical protein